MHLGSSLIGDPFIADGYKEISNLGERLKVQQKM